MTDPERPNRPQRNHEDLYPRRNNTQPCKEGTIDYTGKRAYWVLWSWLARLRPLVQRKRPGSEEACDARVELLADGDRPRPDRRLRRRPGGDDPAGTKDAGPSGGGELPGAQRAQRLPGTQRVGGPRGHALLPYAGPPHGDHPGIQARLRRGLRAPPLRPSTWGAPRAPRIIGSYTEGIGNGCLRLPSSNGSFFRMWYESATKDP